MKRTDLKEKSSVFIIGKGIIIIAILITSSLSFTLGYFVGKSIQPPVANQASVITRQDSTEQKNIEPDKKEASARQPDKTQETRQGIETRQAQEIKQIQQDSEKKETKKNPKTRKYTVQAGAFTNADDADALKAKLDKKGYKTCVTQSETKKHKKLYKVMVGEFVTRKEAELLSIKIKKGEGQQTFVTFKTEQEDLR